MAHEGDALHFPQIAPLQLVTGHFNSHSAAVSEVDNEKLHPHQQSAPG